MMWVFRNGCKKCDMIWNLARKQNIIWLKVHIESIKLLGKVVILNGLDGDLSLYEMSDNLPYVLNPLILLKLIQIMQKDVEININNGNSTLQ